MRTVPMSTIGDMTAMCKDRKAIDFRYLTKRSNFFSNLAPFVSLISKKLKMYSYYAWLKEMYERINNKNTLPLAGFQPRPSSQEGFEGSLLAWGFYSQPSADWDKTARPWKASLNIILILTNSLKIQVHSVMIWYMLV